MKRLIRNDSTSDTILCMSNIRGNKVKHPYKLPFSFYFSYSEGQHDIRVKPVFDPSKISGRTVGTLKLCDDWKYTPGINDTHVNSHSRKIMIDFFKTYHVLFCAVWDGNISDAVVSDYLLGDIDWDDMMKEFDFYEQYKDKWEEFVEEEENVDKSNIELLEEFCTKYQLVNVRNK